MWRSIGDKMDIVKHDDKARPRRLKTDNITIVALVLCFVGTSYTFNSLEFKGFAVYIPILICAISAIACWTLLVLKWLKNNRELDMLLVLACFASTFGIYASYPIV